MVIPIPVPTPYQSPAQGGNTYVTPGTTGVSIPSNIYPVPDYSPVGQTAWSNGMVTSTGGGTLYQQPTGSVAGASTTNYNTPFDYNANLQPQSPDAGGSGGGGGGGGDSRLQQLAKMDRNPAQESEYQSLLNSGTQAIDQGYNDYLSSLDQQLGLYGQSRSAQEQQAQTAHNRGMTEVQSQYDLGQQQLDTNRQKTLRDLTDNLRSSWQQGNAFLGTRGASDSSAANQYAYALTKLGNKNRGDVQTNYDQNLFQLKNTYNTEKNKLEYALQDQMSRIAQWFAEAQAQVAGLKGQAAQQRSQQALSYAMQLADQARQEAQSRLSILDSWAANHATSLQQLAGQLAQNSQFSMSAPSLFGISGGQQGGGGLTGYGYSNEKDRGIFG